MAIAIDSAARQDNTTPLASGRTLGFAEYGAAGGTPVMFFHGLPGSRISGAVGHEQALARGVRVIAADRPGFGLSSFQEKRRLIDWPRDVAQLADTLGIGRFAVAGISGGGPYAAACAHAMPDRVTAAAIISGVGPFTIPHATRGMMPTNRVLFGVSRRLPFVGSLLMALTGRLLKNATEKTMARFLKAMPEADQRILSQPGVRALFLRDTQEAFRAGSRGASRDNAIIVGRWGFRLDEIRVPVHVWQGGADRNVPASHGRYQAGAIPGATLHFYADEGHLLVIERIGEIIDAVV